MKDISQPTFNLGQAKDIVCECGNWTFQDVSFLKHVSEIQSPNGKAGVIPVPAYACSVCGKVPDNLLPPWIKGTSKKEEPKPTTLQFKL